MFLQAFGNNLEFVKLKTNHYCVSQNISSLFFEYYYILWIYVRFKPENQSQEIILIYIDFSQTLSHN